LSPEMKAFPLSDPVAIAMASAEPPFSSAAMEGVTPSMAGPQGDEISPNITASGWGGWVVVASEESGDGVDVAGTLRSARFEQATSVTNREQQTMRRRMIMAP